METHNTLLFYVFVTIISLEPSFLRAQNFKDVRFKGTFVRKLYKQSTSLLVFLEMPGDNCSIYVCTVSRRSKYKGIVIFRVPAPKTEFEKSWKDKLVAAVVITKEIDVPLRERIKSGRLFICQRHFTEDQILRHDTRVICFPPSSSKPRVCWQHL